MVRLPRLSTPRFLSLAFLPRLAALVLCGSVALASTGCASLGGTPEVAPPIEGPITPVAVDDAAFAESLHQLLRDGTRSQERLGLLAGTVRTQMAHAAGHFDRDQGARGEAAVVGALYLIRAGEGRSEMIDEGGLRALRGAIARYSARGDEGRAEALMRMRLAALDQGSPDRAEIEQHLAALDRWTRDTRSNGPAQGLGDAARSAAARALVDSSDKTVEIGVAALDKWLERAIEYNIAFRETGERPSREEAMEASRALETGAVTLAALRLRQGDAKGALESVAKTEARRVIRPWFFEKLRDAAEHDGAREWRALAGSMLQGEYREPMDSFEVDHDVLFAALWGIALEAYRRDPTDGGTALLLSRLLLDLGLPEAAPLVMADGLGPDPAPEDLSRSLGVVLKSLADEAETDDVACARRIFAASSRLLALGDAPSMRGRLETTSAEARFYMASIEFRSGHLDGARPLLEAAVAAEPRVSGFTLLATLERQAGRRDAAIAHLARAKTAPDARTSLLDVADANLLAFEIYRDAKESDEANASLDAALRSVLAARQLGQGSGSLARAERVLGRILDSYGEAKGATRALDRALALAAGDRSGLGAAMLDAVGRALVRRDVGAARSALKLGLDANVDEADLVYGGLWLLFLERDLGVRADGTAARALGASETRTSWTAKLAAWASGRLSDADLGTMALSPAQKVEAKFYRALASKALGSTTAEAELRDVAQSPVIDLLEVQLAREIVAPSLHADLPGNVTLP